MLDSNQDVIGNAMPKQAELATIREARDHAADGDLATARRVLAAALRAGSWEQEEIWIELVSLMDSSDDIGLVHELWHQAPKQARTVRRIRRNVARASCAAGDHPFGRALLRTEILRASRQRQLRRLARSRTAQTVLRFTPLRKRYGATPESFTDRARTALAELQAELNHFGVEPFLISGTLLGLVRDGGFIPWDKDIDVGIFDGDWTDDALKRHFRGSANFVVRGIDLTSDRLRINHRNGIMVDVFPHRRGERNLLWHSGAATRWWNEPFGLQAVPYLGTEHLIPDDPHRYLDENYGNWATPDRWFDARIDAPNVEVTDAEQFLSLQYFSLLDALLQDKAPKVQRYRQVVAERDDGEWMERVPLR